MDIRRLAQVLRLRLRSILRRNAVEDELAEEMRFHLEERTRELVERGMSAADAHDAALRAFGGVEQRKEECRDARRLVVVDDVLQDTRYALRMMRRTPAFSAVAIGSLALGIGAAVAIFTIFDAVLLKPLPVAAPNELRLANQSIQVNGREAKSGTMFPYRWFQQIRSNLDVFSEVLAFATIDDAVIRSDGREITTNGDVLFVSDNYFTMLAVEPEAGQLFDPAPADRASSLSSAVLGERFWRHELNGDASIIGRSLVVHDAVFTIAGVANRAFFGLTIGRVPDVYLPLQSMASVQPSVVALADRRNWRVQVVGRLKPDVSDSVATDRLTHVTRALEPINAAQPPPIIQVVPLDTGLSSLRAQFMEPLSLLMGMVGLLLIVACVNVATLLQARASARKQEIVLRAAIGAGRARIARQLAAESIVLVGIATVFGVILATWATHALVALMPATSGPVALNLALDERALMFTIAVCAVATLVSGIVPSLHVLRADLALSFRGRGPARESDGGRVAVTFLAAQVALAMVLLVGATLLTRTLYHLSTVDPGFESDGIVLATVNPAVRAYKDERLSTYYGELLARVRAVGGVQAATLLQFNLLTSSRTTGTLGAPGFTPASEDERWVQVFQVGPQFFTTLGMRLAEGRDFEDEDLDGPPVAALNQTAAQRYFGSQSAIGRTVRQDTTGTEFRIIAVVRDATYNTLRDVPAAAVFVPYPTARRGSMTFAVRVSDELSGAQALALAIRSLDSAVPFETTTLRTLVERSLSQERLLATMATVFAAAALLLLTVGLYGVMAFRVTRRTAEIGVRVALGAQRSHVIWSVLRTPLTLVAIGVGLGSLATFAGGRLIANLLFGLAPQDAVTILAAALVLIAVTVLAGIVPAQRASRVDPLVALRCD